MNNIDNLKYQILMILNLLGIVIKSPIYSIIVFILSLFYFIWVEDVDEIKDNNKFHFLFYFTYVFSYSFSIGLLHKLNNGIILGVMLGSIGVILLQSLRLKKDLDDQVKDKIIEISRFIHRSSEAINNNSVVLCIDKETKEPVIIPEEDRFLHMLILGPTGSGKTSQILLPLINQDMQKKSAGITVIEPKGDLAEKVYAMAKYYDRECFYFNPVLPNCPYFNPLYGDEEEVIENMATTFKMLSASERSNPFFDNQNENLIRNSLKLLKRLKGNSATLIDLSTLIYNSQGQGKVMVNTFSRLKTDTIEIAKENGDIASWFLNDYYNERSKTYEHCSGLRSQVSKITSNTHLRKILNPPDGRTDIDFEDILENGKVLAISTAQGDLRDLGRYLGYFIILNYQSAVFKRSGNEKTRRPHFLYIDEFQAYSNPGFSDMLTQGRSYRVASHLATQNRGLMAMGAGRDGNNFVELVSTNARNIVIFPGGNSYDAKYYSNEFGEQLVKREDKSISRPKFSLFYTGNRDVSESIRYVEEIKNAFSPSDLIYRPFGEITYRIVKHKTVQKPGIGLVNWLDQDFNAILDKMVEEIRGEDSTMNIKENDSPETNQMNEINLEPIIETTKQTIVFEPTEMNIILPKTSEETTNNSNLGEVNNKPRNNPIEIEEDPSNFNEDNDNEDNKEEEYTEEYNEEFDDLI